MVKVRSIAIQSSVESQAPRTIKLFINKPSLGFEDVEDATEPEAAQIVELTEDQVKNGTKIPLRFVRFQSVNSIHVGSRSTSVRFVVIHPRGFRSL